MVMAYQWHCSICNKCREMLIEGVCEAGEVNGQSLYIPIVQTDCGSGTVPVTPHLYSAFPSSSSEGPSLRYRLQTLLYPSKDTRKGKYHYFGEYRKGFLSAGGI